jgi:hypothetical protein
MKLDTDFSRRRFVERIAKSALGLTVLPTIGYTADGVRGTGFGKAKNIIFLQARGGMSHVDTFDPKEGGSKGPAEAISTSADFQVTSYLPETAKVADRLSVIRTMTAKIGVHGPAQYFMRTGFAERTTVKHPNLGAWAQHYLGTSHETLPSSACINDGPRYGNGFFEPSFSPIPIHNPMTGLKNVDVSGGADQLKEKLDLAQDLSVGFMDKYPDANVSAYREFYDNTLRLLRSEDLSAFDITQEPNVVRERFGMGQFGQGCLLARRLVQAGVRYVEVSSEGWDMHNTLEADMEEVAPSFDQAYAALIQDLEASGLLDSTLVVLATEFGRKPTWGGKGRGHYPLCFSTVLAGGGVKRGYVYGASDEEGRHPDKPTTVEDFHATIGWAAGMPIEEPFITSTGRPFQVGGPAAKVVHDVFA